MLKEIKTRYAGKCATCGREIREGWDIFFDPDNKKVYCKPCGSAMGGSVSSEQVLSKAEIAQLPVDLQSRLRDAGMVKEPTAEENIAIMLETLRSDISAIREATIARLEAMDVKIDVVSGGVGALIDVTGRIADDINAGFNALTKSAKTEPAKKQE